MRSNKYSAYFEVWVFMYEIDRFVNAFDKQLWNDIFLIPIIVSMSNHLWHRSCHVTGSTEQDRQCTNNVLLWRVLVTIVVAETLQCIVCMLLRATRHCQLHKNTGCCTSALLWQIYVAGINNMYVGLYVKCPMVQWNKRMLVCTWPSLEVQFG
jgi:hypothetical protein